jgi:hypothetical protein
MNINQNRIVWLEHRLAGTHVSDEPEIIELLNEIKEAAPLLSEAMALEWCKQQNAEIQFWARGFVRVSVPKGIVTERTLEHAVHRLQNMQLQLPEE